MSSCSGIQEHALLGKHTETHANTTTRDTLPTLSVPRAHRALLSSKNSKHTLMQNEIPQHWQMDSFSTFFFKLAQDETKTCNKGQTQANTCEGTTAVVRHPRWPSSFHKTVGLCYLDTCLYSLSMFVCYNQLHILWSSPVSFFWQPNKTVTQNNLSCENSLRI